MKATPAHANYAKWIKSLGALKVTKEGLMKKQQSGVVLPPSVIKNGCESCFTDNPNLNDDINNNALDSRVGRRLALVLDLIDIYPRLEFGRTSACMYNLKDSDGEKVFKGSKKTAKAGDLYPKFIDYLRMWFTAYYVRIEQGKSLLVKIQTGETNKPAAALLVSIPKAIEAVVSALSTFVALMTSPVFGGAFAEKDGTLLAVEKASLLQRKRKARRVPQRYYLGDGAPRDWPRTGTTLH
jgi:hypothetical protein